MVEPKKIQSLLGSWEKRVSESSGAVPDVARLAMSSPRTVPKTKVGTRSSDIPNNSKSTKQTMEDLGVFVSPREIQKKFIVPPKHYAKDSTVDCSSPTIAKDQPEMSSSPTITAPSKTYTSTQPIDVPPVRSIRDRMKAFERNHDPNQDMAPWMSREFRGKRGSVLDKFTPQPATKHSVLSKRIPNAQGLPLVTVFEPSEDSHPTEPKDIPPTPSPPRTTPDPATMTTTKQVDDDVVPTSEITPASPKNIKEAAKIDRDTLVLTEMRKMIQDTEDNEIEDEMDEDVKECLIKAALQSPAYTRRWYDALTDSWIHCPSLATIIMDFTLIEAAEVLYGDELPMLYTVSLRSVASEVMKEEEVLPEYIYRLAS